MQFGGIVDFLVFLWFELDVRVVGVVVFVVAVECRC